MIVFSCGIDPSYFLDEMTIFEVQALHEAWFERYQQDMEKFRQQSYYQIAPNLKEKTSVDKFMPFPWDKGAKVAKNSQKESREDFLKRIRESEGIVLDTDKDEQ